MSHIHKLIDFTVGALIVNRRRVLLRMHDKYGKWLPPGGHVELDEDPNQAVLREAKEEVGLNIRLMGGGWRALQHNGNGHMEPSPGELIAPRFMNRHQIGKNGHEHVDLVYLAISDSDDVRPSGDDASDTWHWFTREELEDSKYDLDPRIRYYAVTALNEVTAL